MKPSSPSLLPLLLAAGIGFADAAPKKSKRPEAPMRDIPTHEQLVARRSAEKQASPFANQDFEPVEKEDPALAAKERGDLLSQSEFLCNMGMMTLLPKRSVLHVPDRLAERQRPKDNANIVTWPQFQVKNRTWITTLEVSRLQAEGKEPISEQKMESLLQTGDVIIATMGGSPISVLPLKVPDESEEAEPVDQPESSEPVSRES